MLENPPPESAPSTTANKRYVPPNQRTHRRKPDPISRSASSDPDSGRSPLIIPVNGCSRSDASRLLRQRWEAAINGCHDASLPSVERPVVYVGGTAEIQLPHQVIMASSSSQNQNQVDFLAQLRQAIDDKRNQERE